MGIISLDLQATVQLLIVYSSLVKYLTKDKAMHQLFIDSKKVYDSVRREVLYNILRVFMKLVRLIKMCLTETYSRVRVDKNLSDMYPIRNGLKQGDALSPLLFNSALKYVIRRVPVSQDGLKLNCALHLLVCADDNILGRSVHSVTKNTEALVFARSKETGLEVNSDKAKYMVGHVSRSECRTRPQCEE